jgi:hypothetical protein
MYHSYSDLLVSFHWLYPSRLTAFRPLCLSCYVHTILSLLSCPFSQLYPVLYGLLLHRFS